jgi:small-conductance mechanosensitive channel
MDRYFDAVFLFAKWDVFEAWLFAEVLAISSLLQLVAVAAAFAIAWILAPFLRRALGRLAGWRSDFWIVRSVTAVEHVSLPLIWLASVWIAAFAATGLAWSHHILTIALSLLSAWVVINLASSLFGDRIWSRAVAVVAWTIAALNILGLLEPTIRLLDSGAIQLGGIRISALTVLEGVFSLAILLWAATIISSMLERRIDRAEGLTPSVRVLFSKLLKIVLVAIAIVVALQSVGIDLSAFTVFTGALGVGIGFGLQKTVSNLISGVMILMDKSIKPGDVIEVAGTYGWVNSLGSRYASVITRDGIEHLIPNEELITQRVSNWSFSNSEVRVKIPVGVSYNADVRKAMELCLEAAADVERVLDTPKPACLLKGFGDSAVDLELRIWINDPRNGVSNVKSQVLLGVWDRFHAHAIEIPFPQRDIHIKTPENFRVEQS